MVYHHEQVFLKNDPVIGVAELERILRRLGLENKSALLESQFDSILTGNREDYYIINW